MNDTLRDLLEAAAAQRPDHRFMRFYAQGAWQSLAYMAALERVRTVGEWFGAQGVVPRQTRVALMLPNGPAWVLTHLAICGLGAIVVHIDPHLTAPELHFILEDAGAAILVTDRAHLPLVREVAPTLPDLRQLLLVDGPAPEPGLPTATLDEVLKAQREDVPLRFWNEPAYRPAPDDLCALLYTSGTTGRPKGAMLTHRNFIADARGTMALLQGFVTERDDCLVVLPLFHAFAFTTNLVLALEAQASLSFIRSLRTVADDLRELQSTLLMTVPLMAEKLHDRLMKSLRATLLGRVLYAVAPKVVGRRVQAALGGNLRLLFVGGAKADPKVLGSFNRLGICACEGYGLTECAPVVAANPPNRIRLGTIGPAICGIEVRLANPDAAGVGELQVRGPINFRGYWNNPAATEEIFVGDWLRTGDLASLDAEGYLTIRGRAKALIVNREGKNIYPEEVEQALARDPLIAQILVLAYRTRGENGEKVGALLFPNQELLEKLHPGLTPEATEHLLREAVKRQCAALATYKHPRKIIVSSDPLKLTSTQKIRRGLYAGALDE